MNGLRLGALLLLSTPGWAAYQYYFTDNLNGISAANWSTNGSVGAATAGFSTTDSGGSTLISRVPIPDGTSEAEVRTTLKLAASGGNYTAYLQASADAATSGNGSGTFLALEMQNPQFDSKGNCTAAFVVLERTGGVVSMLSSFAGACRDGMVLRMAVHGNAVLVWPDQATPMELVGVAPPGAGQPGIGVHGAPSGNAISEVQLGAIYRTAPNAVDPQTLTASAFPRHIDLQWAPVATASSSAGLAGYWICRDGLYLRRTTGTSFSDEAVSPGEKHIYTIFAVDQHYNFSEAATALVTVPPFATLTGTPPPLPNGMKPPSAHVQIAGREREPEPDAVPPPPNGAFDPRRVGVMALGSYWGAAGEQIDTLSRNLNFSVPLVKATSTGGGSATFGLSYNSQMWRQDSAGNWLIGQDVGYGLGWKIQAGAITPIWSGSQIAYYLYVDSTGAEYRLDQHAFGANLWTSVMGTYVTYDSSAQVLHFNDGSFWTMGSVSATGEQDAGSLYPTVIEDSNGNQILISYLAGTGSGSANTSARISTITAASGGATFAYGQQCSQGVCFNHLASIASTENYSFAYAANQPLASPFNSSSYGTWAMLQSVTVQGLGIAHQFQYDSSGEMTQLTTPLGGVIQWTYRSFTYGTGVSLREVQYRYVPMLAGEQWLVEGNDTYDETQPFHYYSAIVDFGAGSYKEWVFYPNSTFYTVPSGADTIALLDYYAEASASTGSYSLFKAYWYTTDSLGQPYTSEVVTHPDYGLGSSGNPYTYTLQTLDTYGNLTQMQQFDYGNTSGTPTRTYNFTYLGGNTCYNGTTNPTYASLYIRNRLLTATVQVGSTFTTLQSNGYDGYDIEHPLQLAPTAYPHDANYGASFVCRGNVVGSNNLGTQTSSQYYVTGAVYQASDSTGNTVTNTLAGNGTLPGVLTPNGDAALATSLTYASSFAVTSVTGPNGATTNTTYDAYNRPQCSTSSDGAVTFYTYGYYTSGGQNWQLASLGANPNGGAPGTGGCPTPTGAGAASTQWKKTVLDGFGRTLSVIAGNGTTTVSKTDTQYAPCACSPLGKVSAVSMPYAPGQTPV